MPISYSIRSCSANKGQLALGHALALWQDAVSRDIGQFRGHSLPAMFWGLAIVHCVSLTFTRLCHIDRSCNFGLCDQSSPALVALLERSGVLRMQG